MRPGQPPNHPPLQRIASLVLACALASPAQVAAGEAGLPVALYPLTADGLTRDEVIDVEAVLVSGLHQAARGGTLQVREPAVLRPSCGRNPTEECLAGLAGQGAVLLARARREGVNVAVSVALVRGPRKRTGWATFLTTLSVQDARPCAQALYMLESQLTSPGTLPPPLPPSAQGPAAGPAPDLRPAARPQPVAEAPLPPPPAARSRASTGSASWSSGEVGGAWTAGGGLVALLAGAAAGYQSRTLDGRLNDRFDAGTLTPADAATYRSVRRWNRTANVLFIGGGALTAAGATWWLLSPSLAPVAGGGVSVGLAGRF